MNQNQIELHRKALTALNNGRYSEAEACASELIRSDKSLSDAWFFKAMSHAGRMDLRNAIPSLINALKIAPANTEYLAQYAKLSVMVNNNAHAKGAAMDALARQPKQALTLDTIGVVLSKIGEYQHAAKALRQAVQKEPENAQFHFNLASAEQFLGNEDIAAKHYQQAIKIKPNFARAYWAHSELKKVSSNSENESKLESLLKVGELSDEDELYVCHALSRVKEKQGKFSEAFELLEQGKFRYRSKLNYSWVVDERLFNAIHQNLDAPLVSEAPVDLGREAIFIFGMPRSGTTLIERIVSSHDRVESLGELQNFGLAVKRVSNTPGHSVLDRHVLDQAKNIDLAQIGNQYLASLTNRDPKVDFFIDKTPLNFMHVGFIAAALPAAKMVLVRRNPMDTCLSNFRQLFAVSFSYYNYHYDLTDTAQYYRLFNELMNHWLTILSDRIHVLDYEELVKNPETESRKLLEYLGLEWQDKCLSYYENKDAVATASAMQVRQPIYAEAVKRWKKYETHLDPIKAVFDQYGIEY